MDEVLSKQLALCQQLKQAFSIVIIDIDFFKDINDKYGHQVGDDMLQEIGKCILASTRSDDFSGRLGGDEILMAFQKMPVTTIIKKSEAIRQRLGAIEFMKEDQRISTTVSIGIATYPNHGNSVNELISNADAALYKAKEKGRNQVVIACDANPAESTK